jgi:hypothetical protein
VVKTGGRHRRVPAPLKLRRANYLHQASLGSRAPVADVLGTYFSPLSCSLQILSSSTICFAHPVSSKMSAPPPTRSTI